ncbi:uncharacterized protein ACLA_087730 [Aspergillus clavatus NRRL 1]|uniref:Uncharacterized protein n=1 Tax=Aspergillus clavatus (strain ATCC 1007 / CBS 513.65 / DSM 816 / NCTC 3887 / NRRL 1 / QM 1276 / 107) TaxID=344612 RepID=A1CUT0_ASPCL|nr:uncharacterized protein ACLA_087730 [Aspergillus clavatus NRRL 1]EAW07067.1 hypothetical protein ACLA_087730 [Aspergillus clavatus NRRL 1]
MGFVRSLATAVSVVVSGVIFQNEMNAANGDLVLALGSNLAHEFNGSLASSSVEQTPSLSAGLEVLVRKTYFHALRMYVAFAGMASACNLFVWAHKLRSESEGAVLGADRVQPVQQSDRLSNDESNEPRSRQNDRSSP